MNKEIQNESNSDKLSELINSLEIADKFYFDGAPIMSDANYDNLKRITQKTYPDHPYFKKIGHSIPLKNKVKLPMQMGSLDQVYDDTEYSKWLQKYNISRVIVSDKLDGMSGCVKFSNGTFISGFSRGDGIEGADITKHLHHVVSLPKTLNISGEILIRGELIYKKKTFKDLYEKEFANARNMISGVFNRKESSKEFLKNVDFVAYEIMSNPIEILTKEEELVLLEKLGFLVVKRRLFKNNLKNIDLDKEISDRKENSEYELDGIVITNDDKHSEKHSNSSSLNPEHSVKYKLVSEEDILETEVLEVEWNLSKNGFLKPRIRIAPVNLFGTTVEYATAFNASMVESLGIGAGSVIKITKAGSVIPYIVDVVKKSSDPMIVSTPNNVKWNDSHVELVLIDADNDNEVKFQQVLYFFNSLDIDNLKEGSLRTLFECEKLYNQPYENIIETLINMLEVEYRKIIGENGSKIYNSLQRKIQNLSYEKYLGALKYFGTSFGERKFKNILNQLNDADNIWVLTREQAVGLYGVDIKTADALLGGIEKAHKLMQTLNLSLKKEMKTSEFTDFVIVMTGFRDQEFQEKMEKMGAKFTNSVSKKTTHLLVADKSSSSGKSQKAKELNINILTLEEFKSDYNL